MADALATYIGWNSSGQSWNGGSWNVDQAIAGATASVGSVTFEGDVVVSLTGIAGTGGVGSVTATGTAARLACPDPATQTDLTIEGIIDHWKPDG